MENKSNVQILMGANGIKRVYAESLTEKSLDIICLANNYEQIIGEYFEKEYAPVLYGGSVNTREILPDSNENRKDARKKDGRINQVRFLKASASESDLLISENKVVLVSYDQNDPYAVVITDKELVTSFRAQFETLWESLK